MCSFLIICISNELFEGSYIVRFNQLFSSPFDLGQKAQSSITNKSTWSCSHLPARVSQPYKEVAKISNLSNLPNCLAWRMRKVAQPCSALGQPGLSWRSGSLRNRKHLQQRAEEVVENHADEDNQIWAQWGETADAGKPQFPKQGSHVGTVPSSAGNSHTATFKNHCW